MDESILHGIDWILMSIERRVEMTNFDLVIRGGTVFDGTGAVPIAADVGVRDGKVAAIAQGLPEGARSLLKARHGVARPVR
jgi:N-acyl-D-aspartate/D-glutamate deacylase